MYVCVFLFLFFFFSFLPLAVNQLFRRASKCKYICIHMYFKTISWVFLIHFRKKKALNVIKSKYTLSN